jgi:hypothetical protein
MARNNNKAAAPVATPKAVNAVRAATLIAKGRSVAAVTAAAGVMPASAKRYGAGISALTPAFANATFALTALGKQAVAANGCIGRNGQATVMGLTAVALANAGGTATGQAVVMAMLGNPQLVAALLGTKANGTHVAPSAATVAKWAQGYVNGLCRPQHGLASKQG